MYDSSDPRAALASPSRQSIASTFAAAEYGRFYESSPTEETERGRSWYFRGQNFVLHYMDAAMGAELTRDDQSDEYVVILPGIDSEITIEAQNKTKKVPGRHLVVIPPGNSRITVNAPGPVIRLLTMNARDLMSKCSNAQAYHDPHPNIPPFAPWPVPRDGHEIRAYRLDVPPEPGRFGSIYRCSTFMINILEPFEGPRDSTKLSPHFHDDFEQCSLAIEGSFMHYVRWPWTTNLHAWRDDDKEFCGSPSAAVIPPLAIHTSRAVGDGTNRLIDIFCPPRIDFSQKPGWVLNAKDYPMPSNE